MNDDAVQQGHGRTTDMPHDEFRTVGHKLIDWIADYRERIREYPVMSAATPGETASRLGLSPPLEGRSADEILAEFASSIMPGVTHWNHPRFFGYFGSSGSGPGIYGELLCSALNVNAMVWHACPAATELEQVTTRWLLEMLRLPTDYMGIMGEGGSIGNLTAIAAAREQLVDLEIRRLGMSGRDVPRLRVYASVLAHSSVEKAAIALGLGTEGVWKIGTDDRFRMRPDLLAEAIDADIRRGVVPVCVVGTIGTTSCGSIDPVDELAEICEERKIWLHVDASYGGAAGILPEIRPSMRGWERADSFVLNPHKWLFVPLDLSILCTRQPEALKRAFSLTPEYLRTSEDGTVINYMEYGPSLGRRFRAMKLWWVLSYFGVTGLQELIRSHLQMAREFSDWVAGNPRYELIASPQLSTVCFRAHPEWVSDDRMLDDLNTRLMHQANGTGRVFLTHTIMDGKLSLRFVVSQLQTTTPDIVAAQHVLEESLDRIMNSH